MTHWHFVKALCEQMPDLAMALQQFIILLLLLNGHGGRSQVPGKQGGTRGARNSPRELNTSQPMPCSHHYVCESTIHHVHFIACVGRRWKTCFGHWIK